MCTTYTTSMLLFLASSSWFPEGNHMYYLLCYSHDHHAHPKPTTHAPSYLNKLLDLLNVGQCCTWHGQVLFLAFYK